MKFINILNVVAFLFLSTDTNHIIQDSGLARDFGYKIEVHIHFTNPFLAC